MNNEQDQKDPETNGNFQEETPKGKVPSGNKVVKKEEDKDYTEDDVNFKDAAEQKERGEQPVDPIKNPPKDV
jgi:hypothetical protein